MTLETRVPDRQIPFDDAAEQQVIGSLLIDRDAIFKVADLLRVDDFYMPRHQRIYDVALALLERRERIDSLTIQMELARREELDRAGGQAYLRALAEGVPTAAEIERYGRIVRDRAILRRLLGAATSIAADAYDEPTDIPLALDRAEQRLFALRDESANAQLRHITASLQANYEHLTDRMERPFEVSGIPSGFREVDYYTEGFTVGDLIVMAARPSVGKTSLALGMSFNVARRGHPVLLFSLEMDAKQIVSRYLALNSRMDLLALRTGNIIDTDAAAALHGLPVFIDDTPGISIMELRTKARRATMQEKIEVIIVDYLQLVRAGGDEENRVQEIATITRNLKSLARELKVVVIGLSQLSRAAGDAGNEPKLSTLRECVTGDTIVCLADGTRVPISELVGTRPRVLSLQNDRIVCAEAEAIWKVGTRAVFRVRLASGRHIKATAEHRIRAFEGWRVVGALKTGDRVAIARRIPAPEPADAWPDRKVGLLGQLIGDGSYLNNAPMRYTTNTNVDTIPREVFDVVRERMRAKAITTREMARLRGTSYGGTGHFSFSPSRPHLAEYARLLEDRELMSLTTNDLFWDEVIEVVPEGDEVVYDLTVPETGCWMADGIVSHNSGALEQDADIVIMLWRDREETPAGAPRLINGSVAKNRNGPTGGFQLLFESEQAKFFSKASDDGGPPS
jgi:replicative DNA helicase